jgi:hypothetical protein
LIHGRPAGLQCQYLSSLASNATHLVDSTNGKVYVWSSTGANLNNSKNSCASAALSVPGVAFGPGQLSSYNSFEENQLVENYFVAQQGRTTYWVG